MPARRLPTTNIGRQRALTAAKTKNDSIAPVDQFFTGQTKTRLDAIEPLYKQAMLDAGSALAAQSGSTSGVEKSKTASKLFTNHFIQVFNLGVPRGKFPKEHRAFFQLDVNNDKLPNMGTEQEIIQWGERVVTGDAARVAAGGVAMANPASGEVLVALDDFKTKNTAQSPLKDAYDNALQAIENLNAEADGVIKKIWDETETRFNEETPASKRRKAREFGVVYISDIEMTINLTVNDSITGNPVADVNCLIIETGTDRNTNAAGIVQLLTKAEGGVTIHTSHPDYVDKDTTLEFIDGQTVYNLTISIVHV